MFLTHPLCPFWSPGLGQLTPVSWIFHEGQSGSRLLALLAPLPWPESPSFHLVLHFLLFSVRCFLARDGQESLLQKARAWSKTPCGSSLRGPLSKAHARQQQVPSGLLPSGGCLW